MANFIQRYLENKRAIDDQAEKEMVQKAFEMGREMVAQVQTVGAMNVTQVENGAVTHGKAVRVLDGQQMARMKKDITKRLRQEQKQARKGGAR